MELFQSRNPVNSCTEWRFNHNILHVLGQNSGRPSSSELPLVFLDKLSKHGLVHREGSKNGPFTRCSFQFSCHEHTDNPFCQMILAFAIWNTSKHAKIQASNNTEHVFTSKMFQVADGQYQTIYTKIPYSSAIPTHLRAIASSTVHTCNISSTGITSRLIQLYIILFNCVVNGRNAGTTDRHGRIV